MSYSESEFLRDIGRDREGCYTCGAALIHGRCTCCDYGEKVPRCAICRMGPVKLPTCSCGRLLLRDGDPGCPKCFPSVFKVVGRSL